MLDANRNAVHHDPDAELRLVTALKCDIVNSTRIWGALDPSDGLLLTRAIKKIVGDVAARRHGHIDCWEGDGALVLFGYPEALEDGPETAVRAGLELVQLIGAIHVDAGKLEFRVGIATGTFAVDLINKSLVGLAFNMAERLKTIAEPGQVVIAESTKRLAKTFFRYDDLGVRPAKGFETGLQAWAVVGETELSSRFEAQRFDKSRSEIIGRAGELNALMDSWSKAREGQGQVVLLVGEAGMGKSRLARAALDRAQEDKAVALEIDCTPSTRNSPLFPVGMLLRRAADIHADASASEIERLASRFLASMLGENERSAAWNNLAALFGVPMAPGPDDRAPEAVREQSIATVVAILRAYAVQGPTAVLCEDLHWADDTTATVMERFAEASRQLPALLIATTRTQSDLSFDKQTSDASYREITLQPLSGDNAAELVRSVAKGAALAADVVQEIVDRCEGVPLILEEVTRGTVENAARSEVVRFAVSIAGPVPAPLQLVVESRLERWQDHKFIVQAASVLGREFSIGLLQQLLPNHGSEVVATIGLFAQHGLFALRADGPRDRARFTHAMIRDAVYQTLVRGDRRDLHSRVADILGAGDPGSPDAAPDALAQHLFEARRFEESIQTRLDASADTVARGAYVETEGHCEAALRFVDEVKDPGRRRELQFKLLIRLGVALTGRHGYSAPQVEGAYRRAREMCGETAEAEMLFPIMRGLTALNLVRGNLAVGYELSLQSVEIANRSNRPEFRIDAMSVHCYATMYYRSLEECRGWIQRCLALYRTEGGERLTYPVPNDPATAAFAILPTIEWLLGDSEAAEDAIRQGIEHVERPNHDFDKAYMYAWIAGVRFTQRRFAQSGEYARNALEIAQAYGYKEWYVTGYLLDRLSRAAMQADPVALKEATDTCAALANEGVGLNASWYLWALATGYKVAGMNQVAGQLLDQAFMRAQASDETRMHSELFISQADMEPDPAKATQLLERALELANTQGAVANALRAAVALVLRASREPAALELAHSTQGLMDGKGAYPAHPDWMRERLAALKRVLGSTPVANDQP